MLQRRDFKNDPDDPGKKERYQAETLAYKHIPIAALSELVGYDDETLKNLSKAVQERRQTIPAIKRSDWYF
jgi:hypothetical protein